MELLLCAMSGVFHQPNRVLEEMKTKFPKPEQDEPIINDYSYKRKTPPPSLGDLIVNDYSYNNNRRG